MKAKLAWLCYVVYEPDEPEEVEIKFYEPDDWCYSRIVPIVYFEVE